MPDPTLRTLARLLLLGIAAVPVFVGFAIPMAIPGLTGLVLAAALVLGGAWLLWWCERRTRPVLEADSALNRTLKADGENFVGRE